jgi:hypothetical protein
MNGMAAACLPGFRHSEKLPGDRLLLSDWSEVSILSQHGTTELG